MFVSTYFALKWILMEIFRKKHLWPIYLGLYYPNDAMYYKNVYNISCKGYYHKYFWYPNFALTWVPSEIFEKNNMQYGLKTPYLGKTTKNRQLKLRFEIYAKRWSRKSWSGRVLVSWGRGMRGWESLARILSKNKPLPSQHIFPR